MSWLGSSSPGHTEPKFLPRPAGSPLPWQGELFSRFRMPARSASGISRRLFTLGTESSGASPPRGFLLLESWRAVKTPSRGCFSDDLEFTEQSRAASSASVSTFTVLFFRTVAERKWGSVGRPWFSRVPRHQAVRSHPLIFSLK